MLENDQEFELKKGFTLSPKVPKEVFSTVDNYCSFENYYTFFSKALADINRKEGGPLPYPERSDPRVNSSNEKTLIDAYNDQARARRKKLIDTLKSPELVAAFLKSFKETMGRDPLPKEIRCNAILFPIYVAALNNMQKFDVFALKSVLLHAKDEYADQYVTLESQRRKERTKEQWLEIFQEAYNLNENDSNKLSLNHIDPAERMPILHYAVKLDLPAAVEALCEFRTSDQRQFDINYKKTDNSPTAMHIAAELGNSKILQILHRNGASLKATGEAGRFPLHTAAYKKQRRILEELLKLARDDTSPQDAKGQTPLALAMQDPAISPNPDGTCNPIEIAEKAAETILNVLPENKMLVEIPATLPPQQAKPYTYLEIAIRHRLSAEFIKKLLIKYGAHLSQVINIKNAVDEITPLFLAVRNKCDNNVVALLLTPAYGADVNTRDKTGRTVLQEALTQDEEIADMLLNANADVAQVDQQGYTTLLYAAKYGVKVKLFKKIIEKYKDGIKNVINKGTDDDNNTALHFAVQSTLDYSWKDICVTLITNGAELNQPNKLGHTPLHLTLIKGNHDRAEFLLENYPATSVEVNTIQNETTLMLAIKNKLPIGIIQKIITRYGTKLPKFINAQNNDGKTALLLLIEMMQSVAPGERHKYKAIIELLLEQKHGVDVNICDNTGRSPLHQSLINGHSDIVRILLAHPNIKISLTDKHNNTTFMQAVSHNIDCDIVSSAMSIYKTEYLRDHPEEDESQAEIALTQIINKKNNDGNTALSLAITAKIENNNLNKQRNNIETVNLLLINNADPTSVDGKGRTSLFQSIIANKPEIATKLIDLAELHIPENTHANITNPQTTLVISAEDKPRDMAGEVTKTQLTDGDVQTAPPQLSAPGTSPNNKESTRYRVKIHSDNEREENLSYIVHEPRKQRDQKVTETLVAKNTALSLALIYKFPDDFIIKLIERYGDKIKLVINTPNIDWDKPDNGKRQPLYIAIQNGYPVVVIKKLLEIEGISVNSTNSTNSSGGFRPLHAAVSNEYLEAIELLFSHGALFLYETNTDKALPDLFRAMNNKGRKYEDNLFQTLISKQYVATLNALRMSPLHQAVIMNDYSAANNFLNDEPSEPGTNISAAIITEPLQLSPATREKLQQQNIYGQTPLGLLLLNNKKQNGLLLHQLIKEGHKKLIVVLLESKEIDIDKIDSSGATPLLLATMQDNFDDIVSLLLSKNAKPDIQFKPDRAVGTKTAPHLQIANLNVVVRHAGDTVVHVAARLGKESTLTLFKSHPATSRIFNLSNSKKETPPMLFAQFQKGNASGGSNGGSPRSESGGDSPRTAASHSGSGENSPRTKGTTTPDSLGTEELLATPPTGTTPVTDPLLTAASSMAATPTGTTPNITPRSEDPLLTTATSSSGTGSAHHVASPRPQQAALAQQAAALMNAPINKLENQLREQGASPDSIILKKPWHQRFLADLYRNKWLYLGAAAIAVLFLLSGCIAFGLFCVHPPAALLWTAAVAHAFIIVTTKTLAGVHLAHVATTAIKGISVAVPEICAAAVSLVPPLVSLTMGLTALVSSAIATVAITALATVTTTVQVVARFGYWLGTSLLDLVCMPTQEAEKAATSSQSDSKATQDAPWDTRKKDEIRAQNGNEEVILERVHNNTSTNINEKHTFLNNVFRVNEAIVDVASTICSFGLFQSRRSKYPQYAPVPTNENNVSPVEPHPNGDTQLSTADPSSDLSRQVSP